MVTGTALQHAVGTTVVAEHASADNNRGRRPVMHYSSAKPLKPAASRDWGTGPVKDEDLKLTYLQVPGATIVIDEFLDEPMLIQRVLTLLQRRRETPFELGALVVNSHRKTLSEADEELLRLNEVVLVSKEVHSSEMRRAKVFADDFKMRSDSQSKNYYLYASAK